MRLKMIPHLKMVPLLALGTMLALATMPSVAADDGDPPLADCERVLFLHWIDYSRHYACVDQDGDLEDGECWVGYKRDAPQGSSSLCALNGTP